MEAFRSSERSTKKGVGFTPGVEELQDATRKEPQRLGRAETEELHVHSHAKKYAPYITLWLTQHVNSGAQFPSLPQAPGRATGGNLALLPSASSLRTGPACGQHRALGAQQHRWSVAMRAPTHNLHEWTPAADLARMSRVTMRGFQGWRHSARLPLWPTSRSSMALSARRRYSVARPCASFGSPQLELRL